MPSSAEVLSSHKCQEDHSVGSTPADRLSGLASLLSRASGWVVAGGFVPHHPSFHSKCRFPVLIRGAWLQEAGVGVELLKRKFCVSPLEPRGIVPVRGPPQLLALSSEFSVANNPKCFTNGIACRCGYDNLQSMT